jgi:t-SNARE complex subunit (syntaxin)
LCFPFDDSQRILRNEKECDLDRRELELRKQQDILKDQRIANLEKELGLIKQELVLKDKMGEIKDMEILATRRALADMEKVTDRSLKLAETGKPKNIWETYGPLAIIAIIVVTIASVL